MGAASAGRRAALVALLSAAFVGLRWKLGQHADRRRAVATIRDRRPSPLGALFAYRNKTAFERWTDWAVWIEPFRSLPFTPTLSCEPTLSTLMNRFDWQLVPEPWERKPHPKSGPYGFECEDVEHKPLRSVAHMRDPRTVWAAPHTLPKLLELAASNFDPTRADRVVVFSGTEMPLSKTLGNSPEQRAATVAALRRYFSVIKFITMDLRVDGVSVAPMGLCWGYTLKLLDEWIKLRATRVANSFRQFEAVLRGDLSVKSKSILLTRGVWAFWLDTPQTLLQVRKFSRKGLLYPPSNSSLRAVASSVQSRAAAREWAASTAGQALGVEVRQFTVPEFWAELPRYRFLLNPMGSAVQTAKSFEALLVLTIPIVQHMDFPAFGDLVALGFPIVVVANWTQITRKATDRWWKGLAPRLESFRRNCLTVDGYWRMYTGLVKRCL